MFLTFFNKYIWHNLLKILFRFQNTLLPKIVDNSYKHFGHINPIEFGPEWQNCHIPISSSISDQSAAIFGSQCFSKGDAKITIGTGAFLDLITGNQCQASIKGMYPLVAWQYEKETCFCMEGASYDMGTVMVWGQNCGLFVDPAETASIAETVPDTNGVFFVPAFSGLGVRKIFLAINCF